MHAKNLHDQGINVLSQQDYLPILINSFLVDRKAQGFAGETVEFYRKKLKYFSVFCEGEAVTQASQITPDLIRRYILDLRHGHNDGGVHARFQSLRTLLLWIQSEEILLPDWKNPIRKVKAPKLPVEPIGPIALEDIHRLVDSSIRLVVGCFHHHRRPHAVFSRGSGI